MSRQIPTTSNKDKRHNKNNHNDAGINGKKKPYDRSLSRQVDNKIERKSGFFENNPEDELHLQDVEAEFRKHPIEFESEPPQELASGHAADEMSDEELASLFSMMSDEEIEQFCKLKQRRAQNNRQTLLAEKETLFPKF